MKFLLGWQSRSVYRLGSGGGTKANANQATYKRNVKCKVSFLKEGRVNKNSGNPES
jgi:hypothetical protein